MHHALLSARLAIDIIFITLVIVAVSITVVVATRALGDNAAYPAQQTASQQQESDTLESSRLTVTIRMPARKRLATRPLNSRSLMR